MRCHGEVRVQGIGGTLGSEAAGTEGAAELDLRDQVVEQQEVWTRPLHIQLGQAFT